MVKLVALEHLNLSNVYSILRPGDDFKFISCQIFWCFGVSDVEPEAKATPGGFL